VQVLKPIGAGHAGAMLAWQVRITRVNSGTYENITHLLVTCGGSVVMDSAGPFNLVQDPHNPQVGTCDIGMMWGAHWKESPGTHDITATVTYHWGMMPPSGGDGTASDSKTFALDNKTPVYVRIQQPRERTGGIYTTTGPTWIEVDAEPAHKAGAGFQDDYIDHVQYIAD